MISSNDAICTFLEIDEINERFNLTLEAIFRGDEALNYTLYGVAPDGTRYALCTTLQYYGFKPAVNTTTLTVDPKSTQLMAMTKTPEQLQAEAEQNGWLTIWHEWSWWYSSKTQNPIKVKQTPT